MDILITDGALQLMHNDWVLISGIERIKQQIIVALHTLLGDWVLNYEKGIDFVKGIRNPEFLDHYIKKQILGVDGVISIRNYQRTLDRKTKTICITAVIISNEGRFNLDEVFISANR